ncbi:MAG: hypothetical protein QOG95_4068, partial [Mycobacterium sp.]|nr:hypothetical protein [Mycobacterium sp.]
MSDHDDTAPIRVREAEDPAAQDPPTPDPAPKRPFIARNIRRFAPVVVLAWLALLFVLNTIVPQLEPVVDANREPLVPVDAPSVKALKHIGEVFREGDSNSLVFILFEADHKLDEKDHAFYNEMVAKLRHDEHVQYVMNLWG